MNRILGRAAVVVGGGFAVVLLSSGPALAHFCLPADKQPGAGAVTFDEVRETKSGNLIVPGAFYDGSMFGGSDGFIRGGLKDAGESKQFGMATPQAICNGPADHGIIDPYGGFTAEVC